MLVNFVGISRVLVRLADWHNGTRVVDAGEREIKGKYKEE